MLIAILILGALLQSPVDFSGRWTLDAPAIATTPAVPGTPAAAAAPGDMGSGWGSTITIVQNEKQLTVEYVFFGRGDLQPPLKFVYALDGSETKNSVWMGRGEQVQTSRATWDGARLKITTVYRFTDPSTNKPMTEDVVTVLSLESPASLIVETTRAGVLGGPASSTRTAYKKIS